MASKHMRSETENEVLTEIPENIQMELSLSIIHLQNVWLIKNQKDFDSLVTLLLNKSTNPYWAALYLFIKSISKTTKGKNSNKELINLAIMENFKKWLELMKFDYKLHNQFKKTRALLNEKVRIAAFKTVHRKSCSAHFKVVSLIYGFSDSLVSFIPFINILIKNRDFSLACNCVVELQMQRFFTPQDIILPLFFETKINFVHQYLVDKEEQKYFLKVLDDICANLKSITKGGFIEDNLTVAKINHMEISKLTKSVMRLAKTLNVPQEYYPYVFNLSLVTIMRFIIHKFDENDSSNEDLEDFLMEVAGDNNSLQSEAINLLEKSHFLSQAVSLARKWTVTNSKYKFNLPYSVRMSLENNEVYLPKYSQVNYSGYYVPTFTGSGKLVSSPSEFEKCVQDLYKNARVIGMDVEWRPNFFGKTEKASIVQLAYQKQVYLLDIPKLLKELNSYHWHGMVEKIFANSKIVKLGFSSQDWDVISNVHDAFKDVGKVTKNFKDMKTICKEVLKESPSVFRYVNDIHPRDTNKESLSIFVEVCFGKPLNKCEQFSNWERRPLRKSQILYAVYDAFALIDIHRELESRCEELKIQNLNI